jgi:hypothetical protein
LFVWPEKINLPKHGEHGHSENGDYVVQWQPPDVYVCMMMSSPSAQRRAGVRMGWNYFWRLLSMLCTLYVLFHSCPYHGWFDCADLIEWFDVHGLITTLGRIVVSTAPSTPTALSEPCRFGYLIPILSIPATRFGYLIPILFIPAPRRKLPVLRPPHALSMLCVKVS